MIESKEFEDLTWQNFQTALIREAKDANPAPSPEEVAARVSSACALIFLLKIRRVLTFMEKLEIFVEGTGYAPDLEAEGEKTLAEWKHFAGSL